MAGRQAGRHRKRCWKGGVDPGADPAQAWTALEAGQGESAEEPAEEASDEPLSAEDVNYYNNLAGKRACAKMDPGRDPACTYASRSAPPIPNNTLPPPPCRCLSHFVIMISLH